MKVIVGKIVALAAVVFIGQLVLVEGLGMFQQEPDELLYPKFRQVIQDQPKYVYLGDSSIYAYSENDTNRKSIAEMLSERDMVEVGEITGGGMGLDTIEVLLRELLEIYQPEVVIIPINLRSFSVWWQFNPKQQYKSSLFFIESRNNILKRVFYRPIATRTQWMQPLSEEKFDKIPLKQGGQVIGTVGMIEKIIYYQNEVGATKSQSEFLYRTYYFPDIDPNNVMLQSLVNISEALENREIQVIFYFEPLDYETGTVLLGDEFDEAIDKLVLLIETQLEKNGHGAIDLTQLAEKNHFYHGGYPDEHLDQEGRLMVAEKISNEIARL